MSDAERELPRIFLCVILFNFILYNLAESPFALASTV